jgi:hypothetical protein
MLRPRSEYEARQIRGDNFSVLVFDGLIDAVVRRRMRGQMRLAIFGAMPPDGLWLTQSEEARPLEEAIRAGGAGLDDIPRRMSEADLTVDEWRVLSWEYMQVLATRDRLR